MRILIRSLSLLTIVMSAAIGPSPARAAPAAGHTYQVDSTLDEPDADPGNGACASTPSDHCTLRAAIMESNAVTGTTTILVPAGIYTLTRVAYDNTALRGDLDLIHDVTIQGAGAGLTIVDGNGAVTADRVFEVLPTAQNVTLNGLTIRDGHPNAMAPSWGKQGGGIYAAGLHVVLSDVILEDNQADAGAALTAAFLSAGSLLLDHVIVRDNQAAMSGGGLLLNQYANADIAFSQIYSNTAQYGAGLIGGYASLVLIDTTVSGNTASQSGGGLYNEGDSTSVWTLVNSTLSGNVAHVLGGGLYSDSGQVRLLNATVAGNQVNYAVAADVGLGAGMYLTHTVVLTARNSLIAQNTRDNARVGLQDDDCSSADSTGGFYYDLFTTRAHCTLLIGGQNGIIEGQDPFLGPLQDNGGDTPTRALLPGSPAIDHAEPAGCLDANSLPLTTDQRGAPRTDGHCDIGAYEFVLEADVAVARPPAPARRGPMRCSPTRSASPTPAPLRPPPFRSLTPCRQV